MKSLRFGTYLAPKILPLYEMITKTVGRKLEIPTTLVVETSYESCRDDKNDVCFVCSLPYVTFQKMGISPTVPVAAPVLIGKRFGRKPIYFSDVIVSKNAPYRSFADLRGRSWAYNEPLSHSGYGITRYHLVNMGETKGFFSKVIEAGFHEEAINMVARREVDASAIDCQVLAVALQNDPRLASKLKVIDSLGPSTIQPVAVSKRLPSKLRSKIRKILLTLHKDAKTRKFMRHLLVEKYVSVNDKSYDDIRMMLETVEKAGFTTLR